MSDEFTVNPDIARILPKLSEEEYKQLEENIVSSRQIRDPIVLWRDQIVDGHNRYEISKKHGIPIPNPIVMSFQDLTKCKEWVLRNQLGRRNLSPDKMRMYRGELYNLLKGEKGGDGGSAPKKCGPNRQIDGSVQDEGDSKIRIVDYSSPINAAEEVSKLTGVSKRTVERDGAFVDDYDRLSDTWRSILDSKGVVPTHDEVKRILVIPEDQEASIMRSVRVGLKTLKEALKGVKASSPKQSASEPAKRRESPKAHWKDRRAAALKSLGNCVRETDLLNLDRPHQGRLDKAMSYFELLKELLDNWE